MLKSVRHALQTKEALEDAGCTPVASSQEIEDKAGLYLHSVRIQQSEMCAGG